jgi:hypothetical protein
MDTPKDDQGGVQQYLCPGQVAPPYTATYSLELLVLDLANKRWGMQHIEDSKWLITDSASNGSNVPSTSHMVQLAVEPNYDFSTGFNTILSYVDLPEMYYFDLDDTSIHFNMPSSATTLECHRVSGPTISIPTQNVTVGSQSVIQNPAAVSLPLSSITVNHTQKESEVNSTTYTGLPFWLLPTPIFMALATHPWIMAICILIILALWKIRPWSIKQPLKTGNELNLPLLGKGHKISTSSTTLTEATEDRRAKSDVTDGNPTVPVDQVKSTLSDQRIITAKILADLRVGSSNPDYVHKLAKAAIYGVGEAALALGQITIRVKAKDIDRQHAEAAAWFAVSLMCSSKEKWSSIARGELKSIRARSSKSAIETSEKLFRDLQESMREVRHQAGKTIS